MRIEKCDVDGLARVYKALGDETRLRMINLIASRGELSVCDVEGVLEISQSKASRHLGYLRQAGIVEDRRDGTWVFYRLTRDPPPCVKAAVKEIRKTLAGDEVGQRDLARAAVGTRAERCAPLNGATGAAKS